MIYLVAADRPELTAKVSRRYGQAPWHLLVDSGTMQIVAGVPLENRGGCSGFGRYRQYNLGGVITGNIGPNMFKKTQCHGLQVYVQRSTTVEEAVAGVETGLVKPLAESTLKKSVNDNCGDGNDGDCCHGDGHEHGRGSGHGEGGCCGGGVHHHGGN